MVNGSTMITGGLKPICSKVDLQSSNETLLKSQAPEGELVEMLQGIAK